MKKKSSPNKDDLNRSLRKLPKVDRLLDSGVGRRFVSAYGKPTAVYALRKGVEDVRRRIIAGEFEPSDDSGEIEERVAQHAADSLRPNLRPVINATGVIIHTNFGRAPLADEAIAAMNSIAGVYSNLEFDIEKGERGSRQTIVEDLLTELLGCEAAIAVNNNAGAVLLSLMALARGKEVIISRGELVEIGGSFRIPDVMAASGAKMVEVGTTNKTKLNDYVSAITNKTAALLKAHRSNFYIRGFTHDASIEELAGVAEEKNLRLIVDLGSGCLLDTSKYGLPYEPTPMDVLRRGASLVMFSGDKLLGGPQAGIIAGRKNAVDVLRKHPAHRALRMDKLNLAALEATLRIYIAGKAEERVPVMNMISKSAKKLKPQAKKLAELLRKYLENAREKGFELEVVPSVGKVGGGAMADAEIPSFAVAMFRADLNIEAMRRALLKAPTPVLARIQDDKILFDLRTMWKVDEDDFCRNVVAARLKIRRKAKKISGTIQKIIETYNSPKSS